MALQNSIDFPKYERSLWNIKADFYHGVVVADWNDVVLWASDRGGDGECYRYIGTDPLPITVAPGSSPTADWLSVGSGASTSFLVPGVQGLYRLFGTGTGKLVHTNGYHTDGVGYGAGAYCWSPDEARTLHDGFMVISPTRPFPSDWSNNAARTAWYATVDDGAVGVWRRVGTPGETIVDSAGAKPYLSTAVDSEAIEVYQAAVGNYGQIKFGIGTYLANFKPRAGVLGNAYGTVLRPADITKPVITLEYHNTAVAAGWYWKAIDDLVIDCDSTSRTAGTCISYTTDTSLDVYPNRGRWVFNRIAMQNANIGIRKPFGNIGNVYNQLSTANLNYGVWATSKSTAPVMHEGNDTFNKCHFTGCYLAAYRTDVTTYGSSLDTHFNQCIFEYNTGFALLIRGSSSNQINVGILKVAGGHFEGNGIVGNLVNIDGTMMQPVDVYSQYIRYIELEGVLIASMTLVQSSVTAHRCQFSDVRGAQYTYFNIDAYSQLDSYEDGSQYGRPLDGLTVHTVAVPNAFSRNGFVARHRSTRAGVSISSPNGFFTTFDGSTAIVSATGSAYTSVQQQDSLLGQYSARWSIPAGTTVSLTNPDSMVMTNGRFYVWSVAARWLSGDAYLTVSNAGGATLSQNLTRGSESFWKTFAGVGVYTTTGDNRVALRVAGGTTTTSIQTADFQVMTFGTLREALAWFNSGQCLGR